MISIAAIALAQSPAFEAASIHPSAQSKQGGEGSNRSRIDYSPKSITARNVTLKDCIQWAYGVPFYQVSGTEPPSSYDILATAGQSVPVSRLRLMLQDLLAKRFDLKLRHETKMIPVYALSVTKGGPKLPAPKPEGVVHSSENLPRIEDGSFVFYDASMSDFAAKLSILRGIDLPVQDRTGIAGVFDIRLKGAPDATRQGDQFALFSIIQDQLGLKLVATKGPVETIVIEHAERPSGN